MPLYHTTCVLLLGPTFVLFYGFSFDPYTTLAVFVPLAMPLYHNMWVLLLEQPLPFLRL